MAGGAGRSRRPMSEAAGRASRPSPH